jgi:hypothetical protein
MKKLFPIILVLGLFLVSCASAPIEIDTKGNKYYKIFVQESDSNKIKIAYYMPTITYGKNALFENSFEKIKNQAIDHCLKFNKKTYRVFFKSNGNYQPELEHNWSPDRYEAYVFYCSNSYQDLENQYLKSFSPKYIWNGPESLKTDLSLYSLEILPSTTSVYWGEETNNFNLFSDTSVASKVLKKISDQKNLEIKKKDPLYKFIGFTEDQIIERWGIPNKKYQMQNGNYLLEFLVSGYTEGGAATASTDIFGNVHILGGGGNSWSCKTTLFLDSKNIVYDFKFEGVNCTNK